MMNRQVTRGRWNDIEYMVDVEDGDEFIILSGPAETMERMHGQIPILVEESELELLFEVIGTWPMTGGHMGVLLQKLNPVDLDPMDLY